MAKISRIAPGGATLITKSSTARQRQPDRTGEALEIIGGTVSKIAGGLLQKMDEARNHTEVSQAKLFMTGKMADMLIRAETDTSVGVDGKTRLRTGSQEDFLPFDEDMAKTREEVSGMFSNTDVRDKFLLSEFDQSALITRNGIRKTFMTNSIKEGRATTLEVLDGLKNNYSVTGDESILKQIETEMDVATTRGLYDAEQAFKLKEKTIDDAQNKLFVNDLEKDPSITRERLKENVYQFDVEERANAEKAIDLKEKRNKKEAEDEKQTITDANTSEFSLLDLKTTSIAQALVFNDEKPIDAQILNDFIEWKRDPDTVNTERDKKTYSDLAELVTNPGQLIQRTRRFISKEMRDKNIRSEDSLNLNVLLAEFAKGAENHKTQDNPFMKSIRTSLNTFKNYGQISGSPFPNTSIFNMTKSLIDGLVSKDITEENITEKSNEILKNQIRSDVSSIAPLEDVPNTLANQVDGVIGLIGGQTKLKSDRKLEVKKILGNFTQEDLEFTAKKNGITVEQLKVKLGLTDAERLAKGNTGQ